MKSSYKIHRRLSKDSYILKCPLTKKEYRRHISLIRPLRRKLQGDTTEFITEDELKDYQKTALSRARINTPSYSQVVKPIYNTASYRWKNYEEQLVPYKSRLDPWLKSFGYVG